jgi:large subunit ribosomal protein L21
MGVSPLLARLLILCGASFPRHLSTMAYAIFKTGGKQYRVSEGERVDVERLDLEVGQEATFEEVLAVSTDGGLRVGDPVVSGASITAEVVDQMRAKKVIAFKFKRRMGFHKTKGHRRQMTRLTIKSISA